MKETTYELRELCAKDSFLMVKIINKIGIKNFKKCFETDELKALIDQGGKDVDVKAIGIGVMLDIASVVLENLPSCEKEIYDFLASLSGLKPAEIGQMSMGEFTKMIVDVFKKEEFVDFFQVVSELVQ